MTGQTSLNPSYLTTNFWALTTMTTRQLVQGTPSCQVRADQSPKTSINSHQNLVGLSRLYITQYNELHPALFGYHVLSFLWFSPAADTCQAIIQRWEGLSHSHATPAVRKPSSWHKQGTKTPDIHWTKLLPHLKNILRLAAHILSTTMSTPSTKTGNPFA